MSQQAPQEDLKSTSQPVQEQETRGGSNPFPGLRPFTIKESHLFFGREGHVDEILNLISKNRFVSVLGYSGSGKSSLMSCGLIPVLMGGYGSEFSTRWIIVNTRPGDSPLESLVSSIIKQKLLSEEISIQDVPLQRASLLAVLRSGTNGLVEVSRYLQGKEACNVFFLIDQFEEVFRNIQDKNTQVYDDTQLYVKLIIEAARQRAQPVYVAVTMRSDFVGECSLFSGLTEIINNSNYLVPQMTREQKKRAIEGPVAVEGGKISERLVKKLLSDMGNDQNQLPILQHALMRSWDFWLENRETGEPLDLRHYHAIGKISEALSLHANEAYDELNTRQKGIAEVIFKSITEKNQENREMRRPCQLSLIAKIAEASVDEVIAVVEHFRQPGRSFLMPGVGVPLTANAMIELSHESMMRIWNRLEVWVGEEFESASMYKRLSEAASMYQIGKTGLWRPPDLQLALNWQKKQRPTREWAQRYDDTFERALVFLDTSRITYEAELKNQEMMQRRLLRRARATAVILGVAFIVAILFFVYAYLQKIQADSDRLYAQTQTEEAQVQRLAALREKATSDSLRVQAQYSNEALKLSYAQLEEAVEDIQRSKVRAEQLAFQAKEAERRALAAREEAEANALDAEFNAQVAESNLEYANRLYFLTKAQELVSKAAVEEDDYQLSGLQAMQGYTYHRRYNGKKYDPYVYGGLYSALTKLYNKSYNAMKIQGPPRVHLKSLIINPNSSDFFVSGVDGRIYKANYETLTNSATTFATPYPSKVISTNDDQSYLVNGSDSTLVQIYAMNGQRMVEVKGFSGATCDIEFLPGKNSFIVSSVGGALSLVSANGEKTSLATLPYDLRTISISRNGKTLAGGTWSGQVILFDLETKSHTVLAQENGNRILSVQFSPSGNLLAYGMEELSNRGRGLVKVYDFQQKTTRQYTGHKAGVNDIDFSSDEKLMASAGLDKRLQLYVLEFPEDLPVVMDNNNGFVWDIAFVPGKNLLVAACSESEIRVWPTDPSILAERICPKITRNMSEDEWRRYVGREISYESTCSNAANNK